MSVEPLGEQAGGGGTAAGVLAARVQARIEEAAHGRAQRVVVLRRRWRRGQRRGNWPRNGRLLPRAVRTAPAFRLGLHVAELVLHANLREGGRLIICMKMINTAIFLFRTYIGIFLDDYLKGHALFS
jgi:hypothetical protein